MLRAITNLGDSALLLPASVALLAYLAIRGERRLAWAWLTAVMTCSVGLLVGKMVFHTCSAWPDLITSPSGHAGFATTFYGCAALIGGRGRSLTVKSALALVAVALVAAIGASRVALGAHTQVEVVAGWGLGSLCVLAYRGLAGGDGNPVRLHALAYATIAAALLLQGRHLSPEPILKQWADWSRERIPACTASPRLASGGEIRHRWDTPL